jgi:uncharacterized protein YpmB
MKKFLTITCTMMLCLFVGTTLFAASVPTEQVQNVKKLADDIKAIQAKSEVTDQMKQDLYNDLKSVYGTAGKPAPDAVKQLGTDLAKSLDDSTMSMADVNTLAEDIVLVLASAGISQEDAEKIIKEIQTMLKASNVTKDDVMTIANDLKAIWKTSKK